MPRPSCGIGNRSRGVVSGRIRELVHPSPAQAADQPGEPGNLKRSPSRVRPGQWLEPTGVAGSEHQARRFTRAIPCRQGGRREAGCREW